MKSLSSFSSLVLGGRVAEAGGLEQVGSLRGKKEALVKKKSDTKQR